VLGLSSKLELVADIIRTINSGKNSSELVIEHLSKQPLVLVSDVVSLIPLAKKFGFIDGEDQNLQATKSGLVFMNYIDSTSEEINILTNQMEEDYSTVDKRILDVGRKYEQIDPDIFADIQKIREDVAQVINLSPKILQDFELLLTASIPAKVRDKISPSVLANTIRHDDAVLKVIQNAREELLVSTFSLDVDVFKMLVDRWNTQKLTCKLIIADEKFTKEKVNPYELDPLKQFLNSHFAESEIRYVREDNFVSHAKVWLSEKAVHITSANIAIRSQTDNFELGIYSTKNYLIDSCRVLMGKIWKIGQPL